MQYELFLPNRSHRAFIPHDMFPCCWEARAPSRCSASGLQALESWLMTRGLSLHSLWLNSLRPKVSFGDSMSGTLGLMGSSTSASLADTIRQSAFLSCEDRRFYLKLRQP